MSIGNDNRVCRYGSNQGIDRFGLARDTFSERGARLT